MIVIVFEFCLDEAWSVFHVALHLYNLSAESSTEKT
jgi:hypothetical protein